MTCTQASPRRRDDAGPRLGRCKLCKHNSVSPSSGAPGMTLQVCHNGGPPANSRTVTSPRELERALTSPIVRSRADDACESTRSAPPQACKERDRASGAHLRERNARRFSFHTSSTFVPATQDGLAFSQVVLSLAHSHSSRQNRFVPPAKSTLSEQTPGSAVEAVRDPRQEERPNTDSPPVGSAQRLYLCASVHLYVCARVRVYM